MQPRVSLFPICCLLLLALVVSGCKPIEAPPNVSTADILRGVYEAPVTAASIAAAPDVLRQPYEAPSMKLAPLAAAPDVLRGAYAAPVAAPVLFTADVLRGVYDAPVALPATTVPLADVLRGVYEAPATAAAPVTLAGWLLFMLALIVLLLAVVEDFFWQRHYRLPKPTGPPASHHAH